MPRADVLIRFNTRFKDTYTVCRKRIVKYFENASSFKSLKM